MSDLVNIQPRENGTQRGMGGIVRTVILGIAAFAFGALVVFLIQQTRVEDDPGLVYVIPKGASETVPAGLISAVDIPREIIFRDGDTAKITVINNDTVTHLAGPFLVAPGETYVQTFPNTGIFPIDCTVNPDESIVVKVE